MYKVIILILSIINMSCTSAMWKKDSYTEYVGGFYIEENSSTLVAIGSKFHYIFNVNSNLLKILKSSKDITYNATFRSFRLSDNNKIFGRIILEVDEDLLTSEDIVFLKAHEFNSINDSNFYYHQGLKGNRYAIKTSFENIINFESAYEIDVSSTLSDAEYRWKTILSPVTITADAVLVIPLGLLLGVFLIFDPL